MIQSVSKQFLEAAMKHSQTMAQNVGGNEKTAFKSYMQEMSSKRDAVEHNDKLGKKDVQKPKDRPLSKDVTTNDDSIRTPNDKVIADNAGSQEKDDIKASDVVAQNLIDIAALAMQLSDSVVQTEATLKTADAVINTVEAAPVLASTQGEQQIAEVIPNAPVVEQLMTETSKLRENIQPTTMSNHLPMEATAPVLKSETVSAKATQVVNNGETAKKANADNTKANAENAGGSKEATSKAGEAKPIEIKVEVKTQQNETQTGKQAKTEEVADATVLTAKPEKAEMPTITVKVGDGGQINTPEMAKDVADAIIKKMPQKPNEFEIQITPKELGNITIKLLFEEGQTLVSLSASNAKTAGLLSECAKTIGAMIQQHTGNETVVTVQEDESFTDQQKQEGNRQNAESQQQENAKKQQRQQGASQDFVQQMRLGLFDGEFSDSRSRFY